MKPTLYISGAISNMPDLNRTKFFNATRKLRDLGYIVINPHELCHDLPPEEWQQCMRRCIIKMMEADILVLLDDWQQSTGATLEFNIARALGIRTICLDDFLKLNHSEQILIIKKP